MSLPRDTWRTVAPVLGAGTAAAAGLTAYAAWEARQYTLRRVTLQVLPTGRRALRVLHLSDLHLTPGQTRKQAWLRGLGALRPDLVINTGDNLAHVDAVPSVVRALGRLLDRPGVYVWGSNDYFGPSFKNPLRYLTQPKRTAKPSDNTLPWQDLGHAFKQAGWLDLTHTRATLEVHGVRLGFRGTDDAHLNADRYAEVAGPIDRNEVDVAIAVTHAPYRRVLDPMVTDGHDLIVAGHTHGGQVCVPFYGALVTNCDIDAARVKGLSTHRVGDRTAFLHVSAGLGTSPYAPVRFACPPEATLLTLTPRDRSANPM
jgi:predicted MPP superfamily phosphohydrolase